MATKNGVTYRQNLVSSGMYSVKCPYAMVPKKVTVHETDNNASANNEVAYMIRNGNQTSFHVGIDEKEAVQGIPFNRNAWHAGDGGNGYGNRNTISFEICKNYDPVRGTTNISGTQLTAYNKAKANAVKVIAQIMIEQGISGTPSNVKTHQDWSGKLCPQKMLREGLWIPMRDQIIAEWARLKGGSSSGSNTKPLNDGAKGDTVKVVGSLYKDSYGTGSSSAKRGQQGTIKRVDGKVKKYLIEDWGWASPNDVQLVKRAGSSSGTDWSKQYYTTNPGKVKLKQDQGLRKLSDVDWKGDGNYGGRYKAGTVFGIKGMTKATNGCPRLITESGFLLTANKDYVEQYVTDVPANTTKTVTIDTLNVYTTKSLNSKIVRYLKKGQKVKVTATYAKGQVVHGNASWSEVDKYGWVPSVYLK